MDLFLHACLKQEWDIAASIIELHENRKQTLSNMHMCLLIFSICIEILLCKYETKDSDVLSKCYLWKTLKDLLWTTQSWGSFIFLQLHFTINMQLKTLISCECEIRQTRKPNPLLISPTASLSHEFWASAQLSHQSFPSVFELMQVISLQVLEGQVEHKDVTEKHTLWTSFLSWMPLMFLCHNRKTLKY